MKIFITGISGFIGSNLAEKLIELGHEVHGVDNFSTGRQKNLPDNIKMFSGDITNRKFFRSIFLFSKLAIPDVVIHLAANASIQKSQTDPVFDMNNNLFGTMNVVDACHEYNINHLIYGSSMVVYGNQKTPFTEKQLANPNSFYALSKYASERYITLSAKKFGFNYTCMRMFNVFGPKQDLKNPYQGVAAIFMNNILKGNSIKVYGDGKQTRDFIYIDDVVDAYVKAIENHKSANKIFNVGFGKELQINYIAKTINKIYGNKVEIKHDLTIEDSQLRSCANTNLIKKVLNWEPRVNFKSGIEKTKQWQEANPCKI